MKTVEVAIEYVLVGLLALFAFVLPFFPAPIDSSWLSSEKIIGILGLAYLFGVIFDKIADAILAPHEQFLRIEQARRYVKDKPDYVGDPFPQDALENSVRCAGDGRLEWMDALRGRIRTCRGLAVFGLPAAAGIVVYLGGSAGGVCCAPLYRFGLYTLIALLLLCMAVPVIFSAGAFPHTSAVRSEAPALTELRAYRRRGLSPFVLMLFLSAMAGVVVVPLWTRHFNLALIGVGGTVIALLAWWAWCGITRTYMKFLATQMPEHSGSGSAIRTKESER